MKWGDEHRLLVFDKIHKYKRWKNWIKGVYDKQKTAHQFLVTGSARLDIYRRGEDSLLGRYHYWRLHPFTLSELPPKMTPKEAIKRLMKVGGFPEPFLDGNEDDELRYLRDKEKREVDFVILKDGHVEELIEAKFSDEKISTSLAYYTSRLKPTKSTQIVMHIPNSYSHGHVRVESAENALTEPELFSL